jgi:SAM-dependent methyltransferase
MVRGTLKTDPGRALTKTPVEPSADEAREEGAGERDEQSARLVARILHRLRPEGGRLLDFGCRDGLLLARLSDHFECFGYDSSTLRRSQARLAAPDAVVLEEWESLPAESLDCVVSIRALDGIARPLLSLQALAERLAPNGLFLLVGSNPGGFARHLKGEAWFQRHGRTRQGVHSRGEWVTMIRRAGLQVAWVRGDGLWDAPYVPLLPLGLQRALFAAPAAFDLLSPFKRPLLPASFGECLIIAAEKRPDAASPPAAPESRKTLLTKHPL